MKFLDRILERFRRRQEVEHFIVPLPTKRRKKSTKATKAPFDHRRAHRRRRIAKASRQRNRRG